MDEPHENLYLLLGVSSDEESLTLWLSAKDAGRYRLVVERPQGIAASYDGLKFTDFDRCTFWRVRLAPADLLIAQCDSGPVTFLNPSVPRPRMHDPDLFTKWPWILLYPVVLVLVILLGIFAQFFALFVAMPYWWLRRVWVGRKRRRRLRAQERT